MDRIAAARDAVVCFRFDLVELHRCCILRRRLSRHTYFLLTDCLTSSLVPIKPWDESSGVIRPTVEVEEFCQSCPEAAHPHTAYVNNLYVYPLSLNYSNQKVFSKVNLDSKCKCKMYVLLIVEVRSEIKQVHRRPTFKVVTLLFGKGKGKKFSRKYDCIGRNFKP